jgi:hypothetical protein
VWQSPANDSKTPWNSDGRWIEGGRFEIFVQAQHTKFRPDANGNQQVFVNIKNRRTNRQANGTIKSKLFSGPICLRTCKYQDT